MTIAIKALLLILAIMSVLGIALYERLDKIVKLLEREAQKGTKCS